MPYLTSKTGSSIVIPVSKQAKSRANDLKKSQDKADSKHLEIRNLTVSKRLEYEELKLSVKDAIDRIEERGEEPFVYKIAKEMGVSKSLFYRYPEIRDLLPTRNDSSYAYHVYREAELLDMISKFYYTLINHKSQITYSIVSEVINIPLDTIWYYYRVREKIDELKYQQMYLWETRLLTIFKEFLSSNLYNRPMLIKTALEQLGISRYQLDFFPRLREAILEAVKEQKKQMPPVRKSKKKIYGVAMKELTLINSNNQRISIILKETKE